MKTIALGALLASGTPSVFASEQVKTVKGFCTVDSGKEQNTLVNDVVFSTNSESNEIKLNLAKLGLKSKGQMVLAPALHLEKAFDKIVPILVLDILLEYSEAGNNTVYLSSRAKSALVEPRGYIPLSSGVSLIKSDENDEIVNEGIDIQVECFIQ